MTLLDRFRTQSRDKHSDPAVRLAFVDELPIDDRTTIAAIAREDEDARVRRAAVAKLMAPAPLAAIARDDRDEGVRQQATAMLRDIGDYPIFLPTAGAITFNWPTSWANCSGYSDCAPSERALSGQLCTSISRPSAPAAMAARPMGATFSRRPVPCEGSARIGKWESFLTIGMAEISMVLRV